MNQPLTAHWVNCTLSWKGPHFCSKFNALLFVVVVNDRFPLLNLDLIILIWGVFIMHHAFENRYYQCTPKHCFPMEILVRWLCHDGFHHHHYRDHWTLIQQSFPALSYHSHYISFCPGRCFRGVLCDRYKYLRSDALNYSAGKWSLIETVWTGTAGQVTP